MRLRALETMRHVTRKTIASLALLAMVAGCSHVYQLDPTADDAVDEVNSAVDGKTVDITLVNSTVLWAESVRVAADSTRFVVVGRPSYSRPRGFDIGGSLPTSEIESIAIRRHGRGALEGAAYGLLIGILTGAILGSRDPWVTAEGGAYLIGRVGLATGFVYGSLAGSRDVYDFASAARGR